MSRLARVSNAEGVSLAAAVARVAGDDAVDAVLFGPTEAPAPDSRLLDLLAGTLDVGAVVPKVLSPRGDLLEAGAVRRDGRMVPRRAGEPAGLPQYESATDVDGSTFPFVAVRRHLAVKAMLTLAPTEDDPREVSEALMAAARSDGLRVVYEPTWQVSAEPPDDRSARSGSTPMTRGGPDAPGILVVTSFVPGSEALGEDRSADRLLASLSEFCPQTSISILVLDAFGAAPRLAALRGQGFEVTVPPVDLRAWFERRWAQFGHVFICQAAMASTVRQHLHRTQPQAYRVVYIESLPFHDIEAWRPEIHPGESPGLEAAAAESVRRARELAMWADSLWCERTADAAFLSGLLLGRQVLAVPRALDTPVASGPHPLRSGLVVSASGGQDIISGNEEAALGVVDGLLPRLRRRDPSVGLTVISERPSPMLERAVLEAGARIVPDRAAVSAIEESRVLLALHSFGTGGQAAILQSLVSATPFVASPQAVSGVDLGGVAPLGVFGLHEDVVNRTWQLLTDQDQWTRMAEAISGLAEAAYSSAARTAAVEGALAAIGIVPERQEQHWPTPQPVSSHESSRGSVRLPLRPAGFRSPHRLETPELMDDRHLYWAWCEQHGPTPSALAAFRSELASLEYRPTISILMPVYNTDPGALGKAIASVRSQVYDKWHLCIADDGSTRPETLAILEELERDPSVSIARLAGNSGISAATNAALALAKGEFVAFLDHDDLYKPHALVQMVRWLNADPSLDMIYSDEDKVDETDRLIDPHIKPDWSPDHLRSNNYVCHLLVVRRTLVEQVGGLRTPYDGSQDYDLVLRVSEQTDRIAHIPEPLYSWRIIAGSAAADAGAKPYAWKAGKLALEDSLRRRGYPGHVEYTQNPGIYRSLYALPGQPRVAIIIPTRDRVDLLKACVESILDQSTYTNYELVIVDNQSTDAATLSYLQSAPGRVIRYPHPFNYARMMNLAAASVECDALLFLNNDTRVISPDWIESLLEHAMRPEVGAVGGRLYFEDGRSQHEGIFLGVVGLAANAHYGGFWARGEYVRNTSAVTGACMMVRPTVYGLVGGNDERLRMAYNDVDLCLRIRQAGLEVIYTPYAQLYHQESASRTYEEAEDERDGPLFARRWRPREGVDPYYSPMFLRDWPFVIAI